MFEIETKKKPKNKQISFRMNEDEYNFVLQQSRNCNLSITNYLKLLLSKEYKKHLNLCNTNCNTKVDESNTECITNNTINSNTKCITNNTTNDITNGVTKLCTKCNIVKNINEFAINKTDKISGKVYYKTSCKECNRKGKK